MIEVREAKTRRDLVRLIEFPKKLFKGDKNYIPDMVGSSVDDLMEKKNPAFEYCRAVNYLAYQDGKLAGTVTCIVNDKANAKFGKKYLTLSHLQFIDDDAVVDALFEAAEKWGRSQGCVAVHGPLGFTDMDPEGMLVEGFDRESLFITYYNYPYYITQMERRGYIKETDWIEYRIKVPEKPDERTSRIAKIVAKRQNLRTVELGEKPIRQMTEDMFAMWNRAYTALFGVVPMTDKQRKKYVDEFLPMVRKETTSFVYDSNDNMVGFAITCASLDDAQRRCGGRMFPLGWAYMLNALQSKKNAQLDLLLIAVDPALQGSGVHALMIDNLANKICGGHFKYAESGPMLESNEKVHAVFRAYECEQHKRRRCWVKDL